MFSRFGSYQISFGSYETDESHSKRCAAVTDRNDMKKLYRFLSPFAPDQSGACGVFYELGGITVICDAGGCTGNICGFDEPRWLLKRSAVFSAGLRDMDAVMGRDDKLIEKLSSARSVINADFAVMIGTPVPAVIATDMRALKKMAEKRLNIPCICIECSGTHYYDKGEEKAWYTLFDEFAKESTVTVKGRTGIIGATPLETGHSLGTGLKALAESRGITDAVIYSMGTTLDDIRKASGCERNIAVSLQGIRAAKLLEKRFGIPYTVRYPFLSDDILNIAGTIRRKTLVIHPQVAANEIRRNAAVPEAVTCATWFSFDESFAEKRDFRISDEDDFSDRIKTGDYSTIIADGDMERLARSAGFEGEFIDLPHFAVSGQGDRL